MILDPALIPAWMAIVLGVLMTAVLGLALRFAPWGALRSVPSRLHLLLGGVVFLLGLWLMSVSLGQAVRIHLLGMTCITLLLGWRFAIITGSAALLCQLLLIGASPAALPWAWLFTVAVPATVSRWLVARLPRNRNLFLFTLGGGFAGGILSVLAVALLALPALWLAGQGELAAEALAGWPLITLVLFPEGFINGMLVTAACVFFPGAVKTFDDSFYFAEDEEDQN